MEWTHLAFLDTETTGLDPHSEQVFEVAIIDSRDDSEHVFHLLPEKEVADAMHPKAAEVNRYWERTTARDWWWDNRDYALANIFSLLHGAHVVGAVPDFDARFLRAEFKRSEYVPPRWHHHLIDVESLALGYVMGAGSDTMVTLPWKSDELSRLAGVEPPQGDGRHTALGDARWVKRLYEEITL